jgi:hypothetical protein
MNQHMYGKRPEQITVEQLVAKITAEGLPTRLAWPEKQMNTQVPRDTQEWPTGIIPRAVIDEAVQDVRRAV